MEEKNKTLFNINFEEINPDRAISDGNFVTGTHNFRFSVSPSAGGCIIPNRCYFLVEYNFGSMIDAENEYTATNHYQHLKK